jgi:2-polyprenyl-3-methyl-5-hydroxy-6-metoxy-1,4-benzoquinol methylase
MSRPHQRLARQALDAAYYDDLWGRRLIQANLTLPPDEELALLDLGHLLTYVWTLLGDLNEARVLELGCGSGDYTVMLARRGADVTAVDISTQAGRYTRAQAEANDVIERVHFCQMNADALALADKSFDLIVGFGILHHLNLQAAALEIRRLIRPGGRAIFREPLGENPLLELARTHLPYRNKARSPNEMPMTYEMIATVGTHFRETHVREMYLFSMIGRAVGSEARWTWLWHFDEWLLRRLPALRRLCRYAVIEYCA